MAFTARNDPNAARLIESLRHLGYDNYDAFADLVDNSIDAEATRISITLEKRGDDFTFTIADNGEGMDWEVLDQALRLGSLVEKDQTSDLGKFGMGLVTAGLSIARRTQAITKRNGEVLCSIADVDEIQKTNQFCKHLDKATKDEIALFQKLLGDAENGTIVILSKCDHVQNHNITQFANILRKHLGRVHRYFLASGLKMEVNGVPVDRIDPLELDNTKGTEPFSDDTITYSALTAEGVVEATIRVRIVLIEDDPAAGNRVLEKSLKNQGFSVLRNQREILFAKTLDAFSKHNDFNRMRGEVFFSGDLDEEVGIDFTKRDIVLSQGLRDKLLGLLQPQCSTIKSRESTKNRAAQQTAVDPLHDKAAKAIAEKSRLLVKPKAPKGVVKPQKPVVPVDPTEKVEKTRLGRPRQVEHHTPVRFVSERLGPNGQIFECDQEGQVIVIRWNIEHPFYQRFVIDNLLDGRLVTAVDFLIYSMAAAELRLRSDENVELLNSIRAIMSSNMRTLLS